MLTYANWLSTRIRHIFANPAPAYCAPDKTHPLRQAFRSLPSLPLLGPDSYNAASVTYANDPLLPPAHLGTGAGAMDNGASSDAPASYYTIV
jgi:hypothetical protein